MNELHALKREIDRFVLRSKSARDAPQSTPTKNLFSANWTDPHIKDAQKPHRSEVI
jgi:hypothetical protein